MVMERMNRYYAPKYLAGVMERIGLLLVPKNSWRSKRSTTAPTLDVVEASSAPRLMSDKPQFVKDRMGEKK